MLLLFFLIAYVSGQDYCAQVQDGGITTCRECVEITILGGRPDCAYCVNPFPGMTHCQKPFYPPAVDVPGLTVFACYNDSGPTRPFQRYKQRCSQNDCYIDQCLFSGLILWYIIVPTVVGGVLLIVGCWLWCFCRRRNKAATKKWLDDQEKKEKKDAAKREAKSSARSIERNKVRNNMKKKYGLDDSDDEDNEKKIESIL